MVTLDFTQVIFRRKALLLVSGVAFKNGTMRAGDQGFMPTKQVAFRRKALLLVSGAPFKNGAMRAGDQGFMLILDLF